MLVLRRELCPDSRAAPRDRRDEIVLQSGGETVRLRMLPDRVAVVINGDAVSVERLADDDGRGPRVGIDAPKYVKVLRGELL